MHMNKTIIFIAVGVVLLGGLFFFLQPVVMDQGPAAKTFEFTVSNGERVSGPELMQVNLGDSVTIAVITDKEYEMHVHGYDDATADTGINVRAAMTFTATLAGRFPVELHYLDQEARGDEEGRGTELELTTLEVLPK